LIAREGGLRLGLSCRRFHTHALFIDQFAARRHDDHAAGPSQMTNAGRALFVNCVAYIAKFDGKAPGERK